MRTKSLILAITLTSLSVLGVTNTLVLTWNQPIGYHSTLYTASNLLGGWSEYATSSPPVSIESAAEQAFFYVTVQPDGDPSILIYTNDDPNLSGIKPLDTNGTALIYDPNGNHGTYFWNSQDQSWH